MALITLLVLDKDTTGDVEAKTHPCIHLNSRELDLERQGVKTYVGCVKVTDEFHDICDLFSSHKTSSSTLADETLRNIILLSCEDSSLVKANC